jgi:putative transposase
VLLERGIVVSYETVRRWAIKFGRDCARRLDIWYLDEVFVAIGVKQHWLRLAVDQDGYILDEIVQARRDTKAAKRLLMRLFKKQGCPDPAGLEYPADSHRASGSPPPSLMLIQIKEFL